VIRVHVITVVGGVGVNILPQTLRHYRALGVESFFVIIHLHAIDRPFVARVRAMAAACGVAIESIVIDRDANRVQRLAKQRIMQARPDEWFLPIDADEFQTYPAGLMATLADCDRQGYDHVCGALVDRVSGDGTLAPLRPQDSVWTQYPLGGYVTYPLLGGDLRKVVALKGRVTMGVGNHVAYSSTGCPLSRHVVPVHHFKWVGTLLPYLRKRCEDYRRLNKPWWIESDRCVRYFERHGRLDLADPRFLIAPCEPDYAAWGKVIASIADLNERWGRDQTPRDEVVRVD